MRPLLKLASALATVAFAVAALMLVWYVQVAIGVALHPTADVRPANPMFLLIVTGVVALFLYGIMRAAWAAVDRTEVETTREDGSPSPDGSP
ncbi:MAG TPA: hypothetical protein VF365_05640 [Candidatus Limnocylindria bacterium]